MARYEKRFSDNLNSSLIEAEDHTARYPMTAVEITVCQVAVVHVIMAAIVLAEENPVAILKHGRLYVSSLALRVIKLYHLFMATQYCTDS